MVESPYAQSRLGADIDANRALQALIWDSEGALSGTPGQLRPVRAALRRTKANP